MRYFIHLAYDGTNYHGWQKQDNAHSVQEEIMRSLQKLLQKEVTVVGCGRTDAGVHAKDFYLHFDLEETLPFETSKFIYKCNSILPSDIVFFDVFKVKENAHARFDAKSRSYEYHIHTKKNPFVKQFSNFFPLSLDIEKMNKAAKILLEYTDFTSFSKSKTQTKTNNCKVTDAYWEKIGDLLVFHITADRFLRNMVRAIVGTLLEVGNGKLEIEDFRKIVEAKNRGEAGMSVPGHALFLTKVVYPDNL